MKCSRCNMSENGNDLKYFDLRLILLFIFLIGNFIYVDSEQCPNVCVCKWKSGKQSVECTEKSLITIPENLSPETQLLDMSGNNVQVLPNETFVRASLLNLQKIYLRNCHIGQIDDRALLGLSNVVELDLSKNLLTYIPSSIFEDIPNLRDLSLSQNPIQKIENHAFQFVPGLIRLDLSHCQLQTVASKAFQGIDALESLKLNGNKLRELKPKTIESLNGLHGVELHDNPWYCDCGLRHVKIWLTSKNVPHPVQPVCYGGPGRVTNLQFKELQADEFACKPEIRVKPENRYIEGTVGENATINCKVESIPAARISWYWNGRLLSNNTTYGAYHRIVITEIGEMEKRSSLVLINAQETDSSQFYCIAENAAGSAEANFTLRVSNHIYGFAMFTSGQMAGLSIALILLIISISSVIIYLLFRIKKIPPQDSKHVVHDEPLPNGNLPVNSNDKRSTTSPISEHNASLPDRRLPPHCEAQLLYIRETNTIPRHTQSNMSYGTERYDIQNTMQKQYSNNAYHKDSSNPDLIATTKRQELISPDHRPLSGEYARTNERIYPSNLWNQNELTNYLHKSNSTSDFFNIDSNDKTPIIEDVSNNISSQKERNYISRYQHFPITSENEYTRSPSSTSPALSPNSLMSNSHPNAKTIRVWQKGVPVLPPVTALKRVLSRNSPDEGYQEDCGTDV